MAQTLAPQHIREILPKAIASFGGTPRCLVGALDNAAVECASVEPITAGARTEIYRRHVKDFLSQRFMVAGLQAQTTAERDMVQQLFKEITR